METASWAVAELAGADLGDERRKRRLIGLVEALAVSLDGVSLGLLHQAVWTRDPAETGKAATRRQRPITDKESDRWLTVVLTPGQAHEAPVFDQLLEQVAVQRPGRGRPRRIVGDKGYSSRKIRQTCRRRGVRHTIPHRANEQRTGPFDRAVYRQRNVVERLIARCKQFRGLATRYEKLADSYRTLWVIVGTILWL